VTTVLFTLSLPLIWFTFWIVVTGNLLVQHDRPRWWAIPLSMLGPLGALIAFSMRPRESRSNDEWLPT
jgi:hypothetical protein